MTLLYSDTSKSQDFDNIILGKVIDHRALSQSGGKHQPDFAELRFFVQPHKFKRLVNVEFRRRSRRQTESPMDRNLPLDELVVDLSKVAGKFRSADDSHRNSKTVRERVIALGLKGVAECVTVIE